VAAVHAGIMLSARHLITSTPELSHLRDHV